MADALRAEIRDPLWMLSRQQQFQEFRGEDGGSPIEIEANVEFDPLMTVELRGAELSSESETEPTPPEGPIPYDGGPLEALVEREHVLTAERAPNSRLAAEAGLHFLRILESLNYPALQTRLSASDFPTRLHLTVPDVEMDAADRRFFQVMAGSEDENASSSRVLDGRAVYEAIVEAVDGVETAADPSNWRVVNQSRLPLPDGGDITEAFKQALGRYLRWYRSLYSEPTVDAGSAWQSERMEYDFRVTTGTDETKTTFDASEYQGDHLDWYAFSVASDDTDSDGDAEEGSTGDGNSESQTPTKKRTVRTLPTAVRFPGMPANRWWEFEDGAITLDDIVTEGVGIGQLTLLEYAFQYGNDWFHVPVRVPVGSVIRITDLTVTDTFGRRETAEPANNSGPGWNLFAHDLPNFNQPGLFLPPTVSGALEGEPVEKISLARDESANLAFGIERLVEGPTGRPVDRDEFTRPHLRIDTVQSDATPEKEYVEFVNPGDDTLDIDGYILEREAGGTAVPVYVFDGNLESNERIRLYTRTSTEEALTASSSEETVGEKMTGTGDQMRIRSIGVSASLWSWVDAVTVRDGVDGAIVAKKPLTRPPAELPDYRLSTDIPDHWFPFTTEWDRERTTETGHIVSPQEWGDGYYFVRALLLDASTLGDDVMSLPEPLGILLNPPGLANLRICEEEIPRSGREVTRRYQYSRWTDGRVHLWAGRHTRSGREEPSSGLRFDILEDPPA